MGTITRQEAARRLGVNVQTISNWVAKGLLGGMMVEEMQRFLVSEEDVIKWEEKFKALGKEENHIDEEIEAIKKYGKELDKNLQNLRKVCFVTSGYPAYATSYRKNILRVIKRILEAKMNLPDKTPKVNARWNRIFTDYLICHDIPRLAKKYELPRDRIEYILVRSVAKLCRFFPYVEDLDDRNKHLVEEKIALQEKLDAAHAEIATLKLKMDQLEGTLYLSPDTSSGAGKAFKLNTPIDALDINMTTRLRRRLFIMGCHTVEDLLNTSSDELRNRGGVGLKTIMEFESIVKLVKEGMNDSGLHDE